jgi:uroporphyrinogen decarboxylase
VDATLGYVFDALNLTRATIAGQVPLIGFCGSPWTLMAYMIEGGGSRTLSKAKTWLFRYPEASHRLLSAITDVCTKFLTRQVTLGGAQLLQVRAQTPAVPAKFHG